MTDYKQLCAELVELGSSPARSVSELAERMSQVMDLADRARAALAEPEPSMERPDRLRVGDVWEFWTEVNIKGKPKPVEILLQWEVVGWHNGQYAWELQSLDGKHKTYLMEFAPSYEEMRFVRSNKPQAQ